MNCRFCQLGDSPCAIRERKAYVPIEDVIGELDAWQKSGGEADHLTQAGSGEPTLHTQFGDVFQWAKENSDIATVLMTNGSLLHLPEVQTQAALADKVKVTLSAWDEASFQQIHQPAAGVTFEQLIAGERAFRDRFDGELWVEVFIVEGVNSDPVQAQKIAKWVHSIHPDKIDLNTAVRPPADSTVKACSERQMLELAKWFGEKAAVTASFKKNDASAVDVTADVLLGLIKRHPATCKQLVEQFEATQDHVQCMLQDLVKAGQLMEENRAGELYYFHRD